MSRAKNILGQRFGKLVVIERVENDRHNHARWLCQCDCGNQKIALHTNLSTGQTTSCGCKLANLNYKHGHCTGYKASRTWSIWANMIRRCADEQSANFHLYGGRGIKVCDRWRENFQNFLDDMGECPEGLSIERLDNNKGYEPGNCEWAGARQQARNRRSTHLLTHNGKTLCVKDWAISIGVPPTTISQRLQRGWSIEKALTTPSLKKNHSC